MSDAHVPVITIDGPSGTGKGTISLLLAIQLKWHFLDSGAIYRVLALAAMKKNIDMDDEARLVELAHQLHLTFKIHQARTVLTFLDEQDVSLAIRSSLCAQNASIIAARPAIRQALLARQRAFAERPGLVTDGRDMGTVVFPEADLKIYLHASLEVRAKRRYLQLQQGGNNVSLAQVINELAERDERDSTRSQSPLRPANDAVHIDTSEKTVVQVFDDVLQLIIMRGICHVSA